MTSSEPIIVPAWTAPQLATSASLSVEETRERLEFMVATGDLCRLEVGAGEPLYTHARVVVLP